LPIYREATGKCLLCKVLSEEFHAKRRIVAENNSFVAVIPFLLDALKAAELHAHIRKVVGKAPDSKENG
jgi:galactose-1-phosphate uridylyltransferase